MLSDRTKGIHFAFLTALVSGVSIFINKFAVGSIKPPLVFTTTKNIGVALLLVVLLVVSRKWTGIKRLSRHDVFLLLAIGVIGGSLPFYLFFTGIAMIPALNAALIHKTLVLWVALLAAPLLKERLSKTQVLAILVLLGGNLIIGGFEGFTFSTGELFVLLATLLWAVENVFAKKVLSRVDANIVVAARMSIGSVILLVASFVTAPQALGSIFSLTGKQLFWMILTVVALFAYVSTWYKALSLAPVTTVATVLVGSTLVTNVLSAIFITHVWDLVLTLQTLIIAVGLGAFYFSTKSLTEDKSHMYT